MKTTAKILIMVLWFGSMTVILSFSSAPESGLDSNVFCDENLCSIDSALKQKCIDAFNECLQNNPDLNDDKCAVTALLICKI